MLAVFALILLALVLFATEPVPVDVTAIGVLVALLLVDSPSEGVATVGLTAEPLYVLRPVDAGDQRFRRRPSVTHPG